MSLSMDPNHVYRDGPSGSPHQPIKWEIRRLLNEFRQAIIALIAGQGGDIDLPNLLISYSVTGGTENAIIAEADLPVPAGAGVALFSIGVARPNTGNVTINGKPLLTNSGNQIASGGLVADGIYLFLDDGTHYRLVSDQASAAIVAAAETAKEGAEQARDAALSAQPQAFPLTIEDLGGLPDTTANAYLQEAGFQGYFGQTDANDPALAALIAADTVGGEIKVKPANPNLAYLRQRKFGDYFKTSESGGDLGIALGLASLRHGKATVEINEIGTKVLPMGYEVPDGIELIGLGADRQTLDISSVSSGNLVNNAFVANGGLYIGGSGLTNLGVSFQDIAVGDKKIDFNAPHGLKAGDLLSLYRPADFSFGIWDEDNDVWTGYRNYYRAGQRVKVAAVEGNTVHLVGRALFPYQEMAGKYHTVIYKQERRGGRFGGFRIVNTGNAVDQVNVIRFRWLDGAIIEDIAVEGATYNGVGISQCYGITARGIVSSMQVRSDFGPVPPTSSGNDYALSFINSTNCWYEDCVGRGNWAGGDIGGSNGAGDSVNENCGFRNCTLSNNLQVPAAGKHGNTINCGYDRCTIIGPAIHSGMGGFITNCDIKVDSGPARVSIQVAEISGGIHDMSGTTIYTVADGGGAGHATIGLGTVTTSDVYQQSNITYLGHNMAIDAPLETRPIVARNNNATYTMSLDLEFVRTNVPSTIFSFAVCTLAAGNPANVAERCRIMASNIPAGKDIATFNAGYTAARYGFPAQEGSTTLSPTTGVSVVDNPVVFPNAYPVAPFVSLDCQATTTGGAGDRVGVGVRSPARTGFTQRLQRTDSPSANFTGSTPVTSRWRAQLGS